MNLKLMKKPSLFILLTGFYCITTAQFVTTAEAVQRVGNDSSFSRYASEMMKYVKEKQDAFATIPRQKEYFEKQEKFLARNLWYLEGRQDKNGNIFNYAQKTLEEIDNYSRPQVTNATNVTNGAWALLGPVNSVASSINNSLGLGRVDRIAFHPTNPDIVYAGTPSGGLWRSLNAGVSWTNVNSAIPNMSVSGIVVSWADPDVLYVLTGDGDSNGGDDYFVQGFDYIRPSVGVLKSTDGGVTWYNTGSFGITGFFTGFKLVQSPTNSSILIAATSKGLYRTTNGGISWSLVSAPERFYDVEWKPNSSLKVYAVSNNNFFISLNAGGAFTNQDDNFDFPISSATRIAIAVTPANVNCVYIFAGSSVNGYDQNIGVYKSINSGDDFFRKSIANSLVTSPTYMHNIAVSPTNEDLVITGSIVLYKSSDGGVTFTLKSQGGDAGLSSFIHADIHEVTFNPLDGNLYVGSDGGVHKSLSLGESFITCYNGLATTQVYHFNVSESDNNVIFLGAQDNGTNLRQTATTTFKKFTTGDGYDVEFHHNTVGPAYFSVNKRLYLSDAAFTTYNQMSGIPDSWYKTIAVSYFSNNTAYTGADAVYKTTNGGASWSNIGSNGRWALITCPSNSTKIYAAGGANWNHVGPQNTKKFERSDDGGATWITLYDNIGFPSTFTKITGIAVNPNNSSQVWVTMGGFDAGKKVYYSANSGNTWSNISGGLPDLPVNCVAVDDNLDVYIGTDMGVFIRTPDMTDWQPFRNNLPVIPVTELHIRGASVYASTFGRGIWRSETHTACLPSLALITQLSGYKFYEALNISSSSTLIGGDGTQVYLKGQQSVTLSQNFRANASTGEGLKAWIENCNSGGIPSVTGMNTANMKTGNNFAEFTMPFDGKASLIIIDEKGSPIKIIDHHQGFKSGKIKRNISELHKMKGRLVLVIDGEVSGVADL